MGMRRVWCVWRAWLRRRWWVLALSTALVAALVLRWPAELEAREHFPRVQPHTLAHLLADFSHQPNIGSWSVVEDNSNYTTWRYAVEYECGARCSGRGEVEARDPSPHPPASDQHHLHRVTMQLRACTALPLLPWLTFCDELETAALVERSGAGGADLTTAWRARCSLLGTARGECGAGLRAHHHALLLRVRTALKA